MLNLFLDTSALVKLFHQEIGSEVLMKLVKLDGVKLWMSQLARLEFISALHRRLRMNEITENQLEEVLDLFEDEWSLFKTEPLGQGVFEEAEQLIKQHSKTVGLRSLDALHLATFRLISQKDWKFVAADKVLSKTARSLEVPVFNPLEDDISSLS